MALQPAIGSCLAMHGVQVECTVLPQLGAKKTGSVRGASGPITVQVPLSICLQDSDPAPGASSPVQTDGQRAQWAAASGGTASPMCTDNGTQPDTVSLSGVAPEVSLQQQQLLGRGSRGGSAKRRKRAAEEVVEGGREVEAGPSGIERVTKHHKPDLQLLQDELLRWKYRHLTKTTLASLEATATLSLLKRMLSL